ncbi:interleukin-21 receptor [Notechis scutatus]|uniref:Interleukin-21 receptor n=1 Tax=Notechis scutatus TaxID=8663 RepID=A0A6J1V7Y7_9SAUR|nr:interleukin-21 receptor [Notechis scutatus]
MRLGQMAGVLLLLQHTSACQELSCFADYIQRLECTWGGGLSPAQRALYNLTATWNCGDGGSCSFNLTASNGTHARYACFSEQKLCFALNAFEVSIATTPAEEPSRLPQGCNKTFLFQNHIKPYPPIHLAAAASSAGYTLSWETRYLDQEYHLLSDSLQYELRYKKRGHPWQRQSQKSLLQDLRSLRLLPQELEPDTKYEFQVRSKPASSYQGTWSDWSPPASLKTTPKAPEQGGLQWPVVLVLSSTFAVLAFVLGCHQRLWKKLDCFTPSPAPFFQPLYLSHNGDFKKWVGAPCSGTTLDPFEWGIVVSEIFGIGHKRLLLSCSEGDWNEGQNRQPPMSAPLLSELSQASATGCSATLGQGYGHLSIGTVTVAEDLAMHCPHCSSAHPCWALQEELQEETETSEKTTYRGLQFDSSGSLGLGSGHLLLGNEMPLQGSFPSGPASWVSHPPFGSPPGGEESFFGLLPAPSLFSPCPPATAPEEGLCCRGPPSPDWEGESDPVNGLDLDTIDSGFADCDCRSPGDGELAEMPAGCSCHSEPGPVVGEPEKEDFLLPRYVKQWI